MIEDWCRIQPALQCDQLPDCTVYALHVRGTAFLWHQACTSIDLLLQESYIYMATLCKCGWPLFMVILGTAIFASCNYSFRSVTRKYWLRMHESAPVMRGDRPQCVSGAVHGGSAAAGGDLHP